MSKVIILNADYSFMTTVSWQRACTLMFKTDKHNTPIVEPIGNKIIKRVKTTTGFFDIPKIIRLIKFVRNIFRKRVPYSKKNIMARDNYTCQFCGARADNIDHVKPRALGGKSTWENCVASCLECNTKKGSKTLKEAGMTLKKQPKEPTITEYIQFKLNNAGIDDLMQEIADSYK